MTIGSHRLKEKVNSLIDTALRLGCTAEAQNLESASIAYETARAMTLSAGQHLARPHDTELDLEESIDKAADIFATHNTLRARLLEAVLDAEDGIGIMRLLHAMADPDQTED